MNERRILETISEKHSYEKGFNGYLTKYRILKLFEFCKAFNVLDAGCGEGTVTQFLVDRFQRVVAIDASRTFLKRAARKTKGKAELHCSLIESFDTKERFDCIVACGILEHVRNPVAILKRMGRWLNSRGKIFVIVPNALSLCRRLGKAMGLIKSCYQLDKQDIRVNHRRCYDLNKLKEDAVSAGFEVHKCGGIFLKPLPNKNMEKWSDKICDALFEIGNELPEYCAEIYAVLTKEAD